MLNHGKEIPDAIKGRQNDHKETQNDLKRHGCKQKLCLFGVFLSIPVTVKYINTYITHNTFFH